MKAAEKVRIIVDNRSRAQVSSETFLDENGVQVVRVIVGDTPIRETRTMHLGDGNFHEAAEFKTFARVPRGVAR